MVTLTDLQHRFGFTRNEVVVILFLCVSLLAGTAIRYFGDGPLPEPVFPAPSSYASSDSEFAARSAAAVADPAASGTSPAPERSRGKPLPDSSSIDVNTATAGDFGRLPGIGPSYARRIVEYRQKHGPFSRTDDLMNVQGIGARKFQALRPYVTLR